MQMEDALPLRSRFNKSSDLAYYEVDLDAIQTDAELHQAILEGCDLYLWRMHHARSFHEGDDAGMMLDAFVLKYRDTLISLAHKAPDNG